MEGGGGELNQSEGEMSNSSQSWFKNTNMTDGNIYTVYKLDKRLPQSPFTGKFF
jgi:hypothetical protein